MKFIVKWISILVLPIILLGCKDQVDNKEPQVDNINFIEIPFSERNFKMGIVPMPLNWSDDEISNAYLLSAQSSEVVSLSQKLGWNTLENIQRYENDVNLAIDNELEIMISIDLLNDSRDSIGNLPNELIEQAFSDADLRQLYKDEVMEIAENYPVKYLNLAIEINGYYESNPDDFYNFVSLYKETYDTLKLIDPNLIIGVSFQYETLNREMQWDILTAFEDKLDAIYLTSYPELYNPEYESLPFEYYSILENIENIPIIFTEIGWQGKNNIVNERLQAQFIIDFIVENKDNNVVLITWAELHDWEDGGEFETMGLINLKGVKKAAWDIWVEIFNL
jgi:hypothetical protein